MKRLLTALVLVCGFYLAILAPAFADDVKCSETSLAATIQTLQRDAEISMKRRDTAMQTLASTAKGYASISNSEARTKFKSLVKSDPETVFAHYRTPADVAKGVGAGALTPNDVREKTEKVQLFFTQAREELDGQLQPELVETGKYADYVAYSAALARWQEEMDHTMTNEIEKICGYLEASESLKKAWMTVASKAFYEELRALHNANGVANDAQDGTLAPARKLSSE